MIDRFQNYIQANNLFRKVDNILLGVSGGIDSIVMFHLFRISGFTFGVAHCNFSLRSEESDKDEEFVRRLADNYNIPFYSIRFDTQKIADNEGISIQMAARDLRYEWFEEMRKSENYDYIAIAHNSDDQIETFLINLTRGTGIKGLSGIKNKSEKVIRPILFASRKEINDFAGKNSFLFREDSSNSSLKYSRNQIRHEIIPALEKVNPNFRKVMIENIQRLKETEHIFNHSIMEKYYRVVKEENHLLFFSIKELKKLDPVETYLHEFIKSYGFSSTQIKDIISVFDSTSGKQFLSATHRIIRDRDFLILEELSAYKENVFYINREDVKLDYPISLSIEKIDIDIDYTIIKDFSVGQFDLEKLVFPLTIRRWQTGDYFMPLGMDNLKKVSDFFIDKKLSIAEKENVWILESENKIVWIIGLRPDERFKVTTQTKHILKIHLR
ncbi:MAG: tRNA lysidine(34) synthetase TilS [Bacteroidetes bacterium GWF2_33_16]|nr:MAG: tRNA lysidine(34) synthetase TilS [Bacteroidetes bacterium GWE2_32_14]OFY07252.1 MAG: tRNA lysidine(34) synthetase TilS [Bacteroidetes bacterium GWF2_33_16]